MTKKEFKKKCHEEKTKTAKLENISKILTVIGFVVEAVVCFLEEYPRTAAHTIILTKEHYEDISEMPIEVGTAVMEAATHVINKIKKVLGAEKVYMCTMCDDGRNHLHFQLIPRYAENVIGSKLFTSERGVVVIDKEIIGKLRD